MTMHAAIPDKLATLVAKLGSAHEAERLAVLGRIDAQLERSGLTWTDLGARLSGVPGTTRSAGRASPEARPKAGPTAEAMGRDADGRPRFTNWRLACGWIEAQGDWQPSEAERAFVASMRIRTKRHDPSTKQAAWMLDILERLGARWAGEVPE